MEVQDASVLDTEFSSAASWPPCSMKLVHAPDPCSWELQSSPA
jgi:hypothetical protein|eukprot:COSAG01_NODE_689_length_14220_cov_363.812903_12_plen_43_part_00